MPRKVWLMISATFCFALCFLPFFYFFCGQIPTQSNHEWFKVQNKPAENILSQSKEKHLVTLCLCLCSNVLPVMHERWIICTREYVNKLAQVCVHALRKLLNTASLFMVGLCCGKWFILLVLLPLRLTDYNYDSCVCLSVFMCEWTELSWHVC